jgi:hypothetical protein
LREGGKARCPAGTTQAAVHRQRRTQDTWQPTPTSCPRQPNSNMICERMRRWGSREWSERRCREQLGIPAPRRDKGGGERGRGEGGGVALPSQRTATTFSQTNTQTPRRQDLRTVGSGQGSLDGGSQGRAACVVAPHPRCNTTNTTNTSHTNASHTPMSGSESLASGIPVSNPCHQRTLPNLKSWGRGRGGGRQEAAGCSGYEGAHTYG